MSNKLYVGNLDPNVTQADLEQMFQQHGTVISALICTDKDSGHPKGFGFVDMGSDQEAESAIAGLNGKSMNGRPLIVNEAKPQKTRVVNDGAKGRNKGPIPRNQRF